MTWRRAVVVVEAAARVRRRWERSTSQARCRGRVDGWAWGGWCTGHLEEVAVMVVMVVVVVVIMVVVIVVV